MRKPRQKNGFTLLEIVMVFGLLGVISVLATNMFFSILKASTKARILSDAKQNGNYAINVMERMIRNSKRLVGTYPSDPVSSITIVSQDDNQTTFACMSQGSASFVASNGASLVDSSKFSVSNCSFTIAEGESGIRPPSVTIEFSIGRLGNRAEESLSATEFKAIVDLRNY